MPASDIESCREMYVRDMRDHRYAESVILALQIEVLALAFHCPDGMHLVTRSMLSGIDQGLATVYDVLRRNPDQEKALGFIARVHPNLLLLAVSIRDQSWFHVKSPRLFRAHLVRGSERLKKLTRWMGKRRKEGTWQ